MSTLKSAAISGLKNKITNKNNTAVTMSQQRGKVNLQGFVVMGLAWLSPLSAVVNVPDVSAPVPQLFVQNPSVDKWVGQACGS